MSGGGYESSSLTPHHKTSDYAKAWVGGGGLVNELLAVQKS